MIYLELILNFLWVGAFTFGGGYGGIPLIREVALTHGWLTDETLTYMIAVSESTPGPVMLNLATFVGNSQAGLLGAVLATTAEVFPAFAVIILILTVLKEAFRHPAVKAALGGMQPCAVGIILATGGYMTIHGCMDQQGVDLRAVVIALVLIALQVWGKKLIKKKISPILLMAVAAVMGMVFYGV